MMQAPVPGPVKRWVEGARPKTLPAALVPVLVGAALAGAIGQRPRFGHALMQLAPPTTTLGLHFPDWLQAEFIRLNWVRLLLTMIVALALQVGVNYANDYSDGIKGTDEVRVGPLRLVGSGLVPAKVVRNAALLSFAVACVAGLILAAATSWWLVAIGASAVLAAWGYTGGPKPYGYLGLGELFVFIYFGLVATLGTVYLQVGNLPAAAWFAAISVGFLSVALLEANNLRDVSGDTLANKRTLAVRLGRARGAWLYLGAFGPVKLGILATAWWFFSKNTSLHGASAVAGWWPLLGLFGLISLVKVVQLVLSPAEGRALLPLLGATGKAQLRTGMLFALGIVLTQAHWPA
jgi:1,4-dihydroxy-2-naphthoate octaprenyltransferase